MSVRTAPRVISQYSASSKPVGGSRFETFSWYFFRWSGVALLFLVLRGQLILTSWQLFFFPLSDQFLFSSAHC